MTEPSKTFSSERHPIPSSMRTVADVLRVADPQREWTTLLEKRGGAEPTEAQWAGWCKAAAKVREEKPAPKPWKAPADWEEAIAYDPRREIAAKESANIEAMLERMSPSKQRRSSNESTAGDASNPLCVCSARVALGFGSPCLACSTRAA